MTAAISIAASARTRYLGVLGWPVAHSYSPPMQEAAFAALGLDWRYGAFAVSPERLGGAVAGAQALGFVGVNVTVPHKEAVLALCRPDDLALRVGAANTLFWERDGDGHHDDRENEPPHATNTDVHGFRMLLAETGVEASGRRVVVLGAGGAARAAVYALAEAGAKQITVVSRSSRPVEFAGAPSAVHAAWEPAVLVERLAATDLLVDATSRGLDPASSLDLAPLPRDAAVIDLAVRPSTPLVAAATARGLRAAGGAAMLLHQGAAALSLWSGRPAPVEVMRSALLAALASR